MRNIKILHSVVGFFTRLEAIILAVKRYIFWLMYPHSSLLHKRSQRTRSPWTDIRIHITIGIAASFAQATARLSSQHCYILQRQPWQDPPTIGEAAAVSTQPIATRTTPRSYLPSAPLKWSWPHKIIKSSLKRITLSKSNLIINHPSKQKHNDWPSWNRPCR